MLVFPLLVFLMGISLYLMPSWNTANFVHGLAATRSTRAGAVAFTVAGGAGDGVLLQPRRSSLPSPRRKILYGDKAERLPRASCATAMC